MRAALALALLACLAASAAAQLELKTLKEGSDVPGVTSGAYAIVQDGEVVGVVEHFSTEAPVLGRRGGPIEVQRGSRVQSLARPDAGPEIQRAATGNVMDLLSSHMDIFTVLQQQLLATRCPRARQMALMAALQAAAAAAGGGEGGESAPGFPDMMLMEPQEASEPIFRGMADEEFATVDAMEQKLFGAPDEATAAEDADMATAQPEPVARNPLISMLPLSFVRRFAAQEGEVVGEPERPPRMMDPRHMWPHPDMMRGGPGHHHMGDGPGPHHTMRGPHHVHVMMLGGQRPSVDPMHMPNDFEGPGGTVAWLQTMDGEWINLSDDAMPVPGMEPDLSWSMYDEYGNLNWGLVSFVALAAACVAVWGAMVVQYATYRSARATNDHAMFIVSSDSSDKLKPLLHEGPFDACCPKGCCGKGCHCDKGCCSKGCCCHKGDGGVEYASAHVDGDERIVSVMHYEPLSSK